MGAFWFVFEPMAHILVLLMAFSAIRGRSLPGVEYPLFLVNGLVPFLALKNIALKGMEAIRANRGLAAYRQVKPFDMVLARAIVEAALMLCVHILILAGLGWFFDYPVAIARPLEWMGTLALGYVLAFGSALIFCVIIDAVPEAGIFIRIMYLPLYIISGVIFPLWLVPTRFIDLLLWNPYVHLVELARENSITYYPTTAGISYFYPAIWAFLSLFIGISLYRARRLHLVAS